MILLGRPGQQLVDDAAPWEQLKLRMLNAGHTARAVRNSQTKRPTKRKICQKRPRSTYSQPWWPNQYQ